MKASVIITTKNRKDELRMAVRSAVQQSGAPEVIVIDDGSSDGTAQMIASEFPTVRLVCHQESDGYIKRRNEGAKLATGEIIFSIDDDAAFSTSEVAGHTLQEFTESRVGAVAIPYLEPQKENRLLQKAPDANGLWVTSHFIGTAHALRRDIFQKLGGYREHLVHQGEESDYCIRMLDAGHYVRLGNSDPIHHFESPKRDLRRMDFYGPRNSILFQWQNVHWRYLPLALLATTFNCLRWSLHPARLRVRLKGVCAGLLDCARMPRQPVRTETLRLWRQLRKGGPAPLAAVSQHIRKRVESPSS